MKALSIIIAIVALTGCAGTYDSSGAQGVAGARYSGTGHSMDPNNSIYFGD